MARKRSGSSAGSPKTQARKKQEKADRAQKRKRKQAALWLGGAVIVLLITGVAFSVGNARSRHIYDLADVGNGIPAVVQVYEVTCPICNELRANVQRVDRRFSNDELLIRVADVNTDDGLAFAARYTDQRRFTLLFFDADGELVDVQVGLQEVADLRQVFQQHAEGLL